MNILLLDLQDQGDAWVANGLRAAFPDDTLLVVHDARAAEIALACNETPPDLLVFCDEDTERLLGIYAALAANRSLPATIALIASPSVDAAICLLRAGMDDLHVLDVGNIWQRQMPAVVDGLMRRRREREARRQRDQELFASQQHLTQIVDGCSVAMFVIDETHRVTHWNQACEALSGIAASEIIGTREHWRAFYSQPRPCMADLILDGGIEERIAEYYGAQRYRRSSTLSGSYEAEDFFPNLGENGRWLFFTAAPLRNSRGQLIGAIETLQDITETRQAKEALRRNERLLHQIIECSSVATFVIDRSHQVTHWNRACELLLGRSSESTIGTSDLAKEVYKDARPILADLIVDNADEATIARHYPGKFRRSSLIDGVFEIEDYIASIPGGGRWLHFAAAPLKNDAGENVGAIETVIDVTERKNAEACLQASARMLSQIIDGSAVATFVIDENHLVTHWNRACAALTGLPSERMIGAREQWRAFYPDERPCLADLVLDGAIAERVNQLYGGKGVHRSVIVEGGYEAEDFFPGFGTSGRWLYFTAAPLLDAEGRVVGAIETLQDVTEQKRAEEALRQSEERYRVLSITDGMTGLFNARHFALRIREEIDRFQRYQHPLALLLLDVDNFKSFNDTWGHVQGDHVLRRLAECMTYCLRRTDQAFRYGGEEFVALLPETGLEEAAAVAERIRAMFAATDITPATTGPVQCSVSIGVTTYHPGESVNAFVARADSGTYAAKRRGKNCVVPVPPGGESSFSI